MSENQDKRAVYMGTFEAYKKSNAKHITELIDVTQEIYKHANRHMAILYAISLSALILSIAALAI